MISQGLEIKIRQIEKELASSLSRLESSANQQHIKKLIRDKALQIYELGSGYASDFFGTENFIAAEDFAPIGKIVDDTYRIYHYGKDMQSALITLTSVTLAKATRSKALQISSRLGMARPTTLPHMKQIEQRLPVDFVPPAEPFVTVFMTWRTEMDDRVCAICLPLEGQKWELDDPDMLTPVIDTHINCRCRLELNSEDTNAVAAEDMTALALSD